MSESVAVFNGEPLTKREVEIARVAFTDGATFELEAWQRMKQVDYCSGADSIAEGRRRYQLPKITQPRVVADPEFLRQEWTVIEGRLHFRSQGNDMGWLPMLGVSPTGSGGLCGTGYRLTPERVALWADLLKHPNETVEDES